MMKIKVKQEALKLFADKGYDGVSLSALAEKLGMKKPSLYNHIESKESLFLEIVDEVFHSYVEYVKESILLKSESDVEYRLKEVLTSTARFLSSKDKGMLYMRVLMFPPRHLQQSILGKFSAYEGETDSMLAELIKEGITRQEIEPGDTAVYLQAFYVILDGISTEMHMYDAAAVEKRTEAAWFVFWKGIRRRGQVEE